MKPALVRGMAGCGFLLGVVVCADPIYIDDPRVKTGDAVEHRVLPATETNTTDQFEGVLPELSLESLLSPREKKTDGPEIVNNAGDMSRLLVSANWKPEVERMIAERNWPGAYRLAVQELRARPADVRRIKLVAILAGLAGHTEKASEFFEVYLRAVPDDVAFRCAYATVLLERNKSREAMAEVARVLEARPQFLRAHYLGLIVEMYRPGLIEDGIEPLAWDRLPPRSVVQIAAWLADDRKRFEPLLGSALWDEIAEVMVGVDAGGRVELILQSMTEAEVAYVAKEWSRARGLYEQSLRQGVGSLAVLERLAETMVKSGQKNEALAVMNSLVRREPGIAQYWFNQGYVLLDVQRYEEAGISFAKALRLDPSNGEAAFAVACAYAGQGRIDEAYSILDSLLTRYPERMAGWLEGEEPFLKSLRADSRYVALSEKLP